MKYYPFFFAAFLAFSACRDVRPNFPEPEPGVPIRFDHMAVGQQSRYLGLWGEAYYSPQTDNFGYTDDTLMLEIVGNHPQGFLVSEHFRYVGGVLPWLEYDKDSVYQYYLKVEGDTLRIRPFSGNYVRSRIFHYNASGNGLSLSPNSSPKIEIEGWKTDLSYCECFRKGFTEDYTLFGETYPLLNVQVDNSSMAFDGNGETFVYSKENGIVRSSTYSWWFQSGIGWDLLP
jgi:hypothetical protein